MFFLPSLPISLLAVRLDQVFRVKKNPILGTPLVVQWLGLGTFTSGGTGSIPSWGTKIPQAGRHRQRKKKRKKDSHPEGDYVFIFKGFQNACKSARWLIYPQITVTAGRNVKVFEGA